MCARNKNKINQIASMKGSGIKNEQLRQEVELFILVPSNTIIHNYIYKISVGSTEHLTEIYNQSPIQNIEGSQGYKQLPKTVKLTFNLEEKQYIVIKVLQRSDSTSYGMSYPISLSKICSLRRELNKVPIFNGQSMVSQFAIHSKEISSKSYETTIAISTGNICKKEGSFCFMSFQPIKHYFLIHQPINNGRIILARSRQTQAKSQNFDKMKLITTNQQPLRQIIVNFYQSTANKLIGETRIDLNNLKKNEQYYLNKRDKTQGFFKIEMISNEKIHHFLQFYKSGMELALTVAIDFTMSNLYYKQQNSLHYHTDNKRSVYLQVLSTVCPILLDFDTDKKVPVHGFGAIQAGETKASHYFPLAKDRLNYQVYKTQGILNAYKQAMPRLTFSGPTYFSPMLQENIRQSKQFRNHPQSYKILLILTDGDIMDYYQVVDLIIQCSQLPISIIIVGISKDKNEKWELMQRLNNNQLQLKDRRGRCATRDMVTFVPYFETIQTPGKFQKQLLSQLPNQISQYHRLARIKPSDYLVHRAGLDAIEAQNSDMQRVRDRIGLGREINPEEIKPQYYENEQSVMRLSQNSNLKTKLRAKNFYQERQQ